MPDAVREFVATAELVDEFRLGNRTALARAISIVENGSAGHVELIRELAPAGTAYRIGITGPPGVGKSTLTGRLMQSYRQREKTVAAVVVDPTSPVTGGALLGDRIRMADIALDPGVFVRSMATRGAHGGLATATSRVCDLLDAFGFDRIIIETVGTGQSDLAVTDVADTTALVLVPESGDGVQVLKAGIMELADLFVVNKADRAGSDQMVADLGTLMEIRGADVESATRSGAARNPPVLQTVALKGTGVSELVEALEEIAEKTVG